MKQKRDLNSLIAAVVEEDDEVVVVVYLFVVQEPSVLYRSHASWLVTHYSWPWLKEKEIYFNANDDPHTFSMRKREKNCFGH